ncbi:MAG TPA: transketolase C-terminal domain-containing protein [Telmatospirillum sp.]|nr:transketolase C-terminal domain-containing protein [Telmatospirillum sp.]
MRKIALDMVHELAKKDPRVIFLGSDLGAGTLDKMRQEFPERFYMEGICEANFVGMAAGLAMEGFIPYLNTIAPFFTRRAFEQIAIDLCLHKLPVRLISSGGGVVYAPLGPTHLAIEDIAVMRALPNMTVVAVSDADEMRRLMEQTLDWPGPIYIRLAKGGDPIVSDAKRGFTIGKAITVREPSDILLLTTGVMLGRAVEAADSLASEGTECGIVHLHTIKPLDSAAVLKAAAKARLVVTIEEHIRSGGLGSAVLETLADGLPSLLPPVLRLGLPDAFPKEYGSQETMFDSFGLTPTQIADAIRHALVRA